MSYSIDGNYTPDLVENFSKTQDLKMAKVIAKNVYDSTSKYFRNKQTGKNIAKGATKLGGVAKGSTKLGRLAKGAKN